MAFFRDTIGGQVATLNAVNDQLTRDAQIQKEQAMRQYLIGKQFGDDKMTGVATRDMNTGLIPNMMNKGLDLFLGSGRHNPDVEKFSDIEMPDEQKMQENKTYYDGASNLRGKSFEDKVRAYATQAYAEAGEDGMGFDEERFKKDFYKNGRLKRADDLPDHIRDSYKKARKELEAFQKVTPSKEERDEIGLAEHLKKHKIDGKTDFSGSHSNMNNENLKYHKALVDFYVKNKNWDKAQEIQQSYERNQQNIDKHWGDQGTKEYQSLFSRPKGAGAGKPKPFGLVMPEGEVTFNLPESQWDNPNAIYAALVKHKGKAVADRYKELIAAGQGPDHFDAGQKNRAELSHEKYAKEQEQITQLEKEAGDYWFFNNDKKVNSKYLSDPKVKHVSINGELVSKSLVKGSPAMQAKLIEQTGVTKSELTKMLAGF